MSKELTEQWKKGELLAGLYYFRKTDGLIEIEFHDDYRGFCTQEEYIKEVLAPVPDYEEYEDIIQQNVNQESAIETYIEEIKRLQKQLNDANDIIDFYFPKTKKINSVCIEPLKLYRKKWGVK